MAESKTVDAYRQPPPSDAAALYQRGRALIEGQPQPVPDWVNADPETWFELSFYSKCAANRDDDPDRGIDGLAINLTYREYLELKATLARVRGHIALEETDAGK